MTTLYSMFPNAYGNQAYTQPAVMRDPTVTPAPVIEVQNVNFVVSRIA